MNALHFARGRGGLAGGILALLVALAFALATANPLRAQTQVEVFETPAGHEVWLVEAREIPFVALELRFAGGAAVDPEGQEGATSLAVALLDRGAGDLDEAGFAQALEEIAASVDFATSRDFVSVSARFLSETAQSAAELLGLALTQPRLDPEAVERMRARFASSSRSDERNPNALASREFARLAFGDHPYGRPADGTEDSIAALDEAALRAALDRALARDRVQVTAVGDIDAAALAVLVDAMLADLPAEGAPLPQTARVQLSPGTTVVPFDGPQSVVAFGHAGIPREDPDFLAAFVGMEVLGGGRFGTRLMDELRGRGLTYGVGAFMAAGPHGATLQGRFSTSNDRVGEAIELVRAEWTRMAEEGLSAEEHAAIVTYLTGAFPLRFDGNAAIARMLAGFRAQGLPVTYVSERNDLIAGLTREDVNAALARVLDPEGLHFVVVGQPEGLDASH